jgi:nitric oxide reductase NorQ protein
MTETLELKEEITQESLNVNPDIRKTHEIPVDTEFELVGILKGHPWYPYANDLLGKKFVKPEHAGGQCIPISGQEFSETIETLIANGMGYIHFDTAYGCYGITDEDNEKFNEKEEIVAGITVKKTRVKRVVSDSKVQVTTAKKRTTKDFITLGGVFKVSTPIYNVLKRNIEKGTNTLLLGPTGVGKTEMVAHIAADLKLPLTIFDMGTMSDPIMSLVGSHVIQVKGGKTSSEFKKSRFSEVIQQPGVVLLDELSRSPAQANNLLFPCLDFRKELPMEYCFEDTTSIKVHPQCVFVATANLGSQYTGTHKLDRALLDRFMLMEIDPLKKAQIVEVLKYHNPALKPEEITKIVDCYEKINKAHDDFSVSFNLSLRHLKMIAELVRDGFTIYDSFYVICKGIGSKDGLKSLDSILKTTK